MIRRVSFLVVFFLLAGVSRAAYVESFVAGSASYTQTSDSLVVIPRSFPGTVLIGVLIGTPTAAGSIKVYDSSGSATNQLGNIDLGARFYAPFDVKITSGITYTTTGNSGGITILYKKLRN